MKTVIHINGIDCYAYHGCLEAEGIIGGHYQVDVSIEKDVEKAVFNDELHDTIDYVTVHKIVREQMGIRSKLIEHAGGRILKELAHAFGGKKIITVRVTKFNPPVNGQIRDVNITLSDTLD
jgi:7,8-dihydroneopterin aldolase/epimerase/oxygenase